MSVQAELVAGYPALAEGPPAWHSHVASTRKSVRVSTLRHLLGPCPFDFAGRTRAQVLIPYADWDLSSAVQRRLLMAHLASGHDVIFYEGAQKPTAAS